MNRTTRTVVKIFLIAAGTAACLAAAYYAGSNATGHALATASDNMNYSRWLEKYFALTRATGLANGLCALSWFLAARFVFEVDEAAGAGYWLLTIFTTPLAFKYTPLGAQLILMRNA